MIPWTAEEERLLMQNGNRGADWCRREISKRFRIKRTRRAVEVHASKLGVSLRKFRAYECPECHLEFSRLIPATGMCRECTARANLEQLELRKQRIQRNDVDSKREEVERVRRKANALRKWCNTN